MVKNVKKVEGVKGDYVTIRVLMPKKIYKAVKIKGLVMDKTVNKVIVDCLTKYVTRIQQAFDDMKAKG